MSRPRWPGGLDLEAENPIPPPSKRVWCRLNPSGPNVLPLVWCGSLEMRVLAQVSSSSSDRGSKLRACRCENGKCEGEDGKQICKCNPGFGNFSKITCRACECGPDTNCMWEPGWSVKKICFCKPEYSQKSTKCEACNCGPDTNCTFTDQGFFKPYLKKCLCKPGYNEEEGKCVEKRSELLVLRGSPMSNQLVEQP
ncbi:hypothetical protein AVEN_45038-1 [Araneus ventricosus]|uniref:EGF-like domain-containing protein n=1 Tax=Araneus ventricosus TaxID=182803 RepID=A0A4Y2IQB1_ARAVE|nr:hypothetical protein AVEN_45038-1 [Araneus ventricosus]